MKYFVQWEELVYDGFDVLENINAGEAFQIEAETYSLALDLAESQANHLIDLKRPDKSHGDFTPRILALTELGGKGKRHVVNEPAKIE